MLSTSLRRIFAPRTAAATAILVVAASGVAYAGFGSAQVTNNSLTSLDIKNNSLTEADVKNGALRGRDFRANSITGAQIDESTLAKVPSAAAADIATSATSATTSTNATNATNADKLDNLDSTEFVKTQNLVHVFQSMMAGSPDVTLVTNGDIAVKLGCEVSGGNEILRVFATTTTDGAILDSQDDTADPLNTTTLASDSEMYANTAVAATKYVTDGYDETGFVINSTGTRVITMLEGSISVVQNSFGKDCTFGGTFMVKSIA
jgi:hypothetical protein